MVADGGSRRSRVPAPRSAVGVSRGEWTGAVTKLPVRRRLDRAASLTAHFNAAQRAAESLQPSARRLLEDRYSHHFAGPYKRVLVTSGVAHTAIKVIDHYLGGLHAHIMLRARYADDVLRDAIAGGRTQLVLLGAGFDTTAYRTQAAVTATIFEADAPHTQAEKRRIIAHNSLPVPDNVTWVPCDFEYDLLSECLQQQGFNPAQPCVVVWLGVSFYLTPAAFDHTLTELAGLSAPTSLLVLDYGDPQLVSGNHELAAARRAARVVRRRGEPYLTGFTEPQLTATLAAHGYTVRDHARIPGLMKRYAPGGVSYAVDDWLGICTAERVT